MTIDRVLSTLEEYFHLKNELITNSDEGEADIHLIEDARFRAKMALNEHIKSQFDAVVNEETRRSSSNITSKIRVASPTDSTIISWDDVVKMLDALNSPPTPLKHPTIDNIIVWMDAYKSWYDSRRINAIKTISSITNAIDNYSDDVIIGSDREKETINSIPSVLIKESDSIETITVDELNFDFKDSD